MWTYKKATITKLSLKRAQMHKIERGERSLGDYIFTLDFDEKRGESEWDMLIALNLDNEKNNGMIKAYWSYNKLNANFLFKSSSQSESNVTSGYSHNIGGDSMLPAFIIYSTTSGGSSRTKFSVYAAGAVVDCLTCWLSNQHFPVANTSFEHTIGEGYRFDL